MYYTHHCTQDRNYSFNSHPPDARPRVDYFLLSTQILYCILDVEQLSCLLSDHSPHVMTLSIPEKIRGAYSWKLNPILLKQPEFHKFIRDQIHISTSNN